VQEAAARVSGHYIKWGPLTVAGPSPCVKGTPCAELLRKWRELTGTRVLLQGESHPMCGAAFYLDDDFYYWQGSAFGPLLEWLSRREGACREFVSNAVFINFETKKAYCVQEADHPRNWPDLQQNLGTVTVPVDPMEGYTKALDLLAKEREKLRIERERTTALLARIAELQKNKKRRREDEDEDEDEVEEELESKRARLDDARMNKKALRNVIDFINVLVPDPEEGE
jgi:hypothetical protein